MADIIYNGGQRRKYAPGERPIQFKRKEVTPAKVVPVPPLEIHPKFADKHFMVMSDVNEFVPGVEAKMVDWFWGNMEKGYHLWAPGEHYGFDWIVPPCEVGYAGSVEGSYEFDPTNVIKITRASVEYYPFTECYEHCWMSCFGDSTPDSGFLIHMYQDTEGGIFWRSVSVSSEERMKAMAEQMKKLAEMAEKTGMTPPPRPNIAEHMAFESAMLGEFLPGLYKVWEGHPDPWQNVNFDLTTVRQEDGTWRHKYTNVPPTREEVEKALAEGTPYPKH